MNKVILIGRLCAKPEAATTQSGIVRSNFRLAVNRRYKNDAGNYDADFLPIVAWRQTAEFCNKYLDKGRQVAVEGSIQTRSYDAQDGSKRYVTEIIADNVEALGSAEKAPEAASEQPAAEAKDFVEVEDDDDLPF